MSFDLTDYEARRRRDPERQKYMYEYNQKPEYKEGKRKYHRSSRYKKLDRERNLSFVRKQYQREWQKNKKLKVSGTATLENFFS